MSTPDSTQPRASSIAFVGFGIRGRLALIAGIYQDIADLKQGRTINTAPRTHDYYDLQRPGKGPGGTFQRSSDACLTTGLPGPIDLNMPLLDATEQSVLNRETDLGRAYHDVLMRRPRLWNLKDLARKNIFSALVYAEASKNTNAMRRLDVSDACGPRSVVGEALDYMVKRALLHARNDLPWLTINFCEGVKIVDINLDDPQRPFLVYQRRLENSRNETAAYDLIVKASGLTWDAPVKGVEADHAYTGIPNAIKIKEYLKKKDLFGIDKVSSQITPGSQILIGYDGWSPFDEVGIILVWTGIIKINAKDSTQWSIDKNRAKMYPNLITLFSDTEGLFVRSRYDTNPNKWVDSATTFSPAMQLSLRLQKNVDLYQTYLEQARLVTARRFEKLPVDIEPPLTTKQLLKHLLDVNIHYENPIKNAELGPPETSVVQNVLSTLRPFSVFGRDASQLTLELALEYPMLYRDGWDVARANAFGPTHDATLERGQMFDHLDAQDEVMSYVDAAPFKIHSIITELAALNVITWKKGNYKQITWINPDQHFNFNGENYDALFAHPVVTTETDTLSRRITEKSRRQIPGEPVYAKGRFPISPNGRPMHIIELGLPGHGNWKRGVFSGSQWTDTDNLASAAQLMPIVAKTINLLEKMFVTSVPEPMFRLGQLYRLGLPEPDEFEAEAERLHAPYLECRLILVWTRLVAKVFPIGLAFEQIVRKAVDSTRSRRAIAEMIRKSDMPGAAEAFKAYKKDLKTIRWDPYDLAGFEATTPDFSDRQILFMRRMYGMSVGEEWPTSPILGSESSGSSRKSSETPNSAASPFEIPLTRTRVHKRSQN